MWKRFFKLTLIALSVTEFFITKLCLLKLEAAPWRKRLVTRLPPLRSRVRDSVSPCGFRDGRNGMLVGFLQVSPILPVTIFIPPFLYTHLIHFVSFHQPLWCCDRHSRPASFLFIDLQYRSSTHLIPRSGPVSDKSWHIYTGRIKIDGANWHGWKYTIFEAIKS